MAPDILIYVDNILGDDDKDGSESRPVRTLTGAFNLLPPVWTRRAEIIFATTGDRPAYLVTTSTVYLGTPVGPYASPLVLRGGYTTEFDVEADRASAGDEVVTRTPASLPDAIIGCVLRRVSLSGSFFGPAVSIRGSSVGDNMTIWPQANIGPVEENQKFVVQRPAVTLELSGTLNLTSLDQRSLNLTMIGIGINVNLGGGLNLFNVRAQCDTCWFGFMPGQGFVHTNSRIQGGIKDVDLSPNLDPNRAQAGVFIYASHTSNVFSAVRGGVLGGHLTFKTITVRVSQGGTFVPLTLEALNAPIQILAGGTALAEITPGATGGWGTLNNKARIRDVVTTTPGPPPAGGQPDGDGLRVSSGGSISSPLPLHLNICGCNRDGIRVDAGSTASFGPPGGITGLVTDGASNARFGMHVRNASRALVGSDAHIANVGSNPDPKPLTGNWGQVALDGRSADDAILGGWGTVVAGPRSNGKLSLVCVNG